MHAVTVLALAAAAGSGSAVLAIGAQESPIFRTTADLVRVPAVVFSSDGRPVMDLAVEDFKITEQGEERPISVFIGPDSGPIEVALVLDASSSMSRWPTREATTALLNSLDPGSCVLVLPFQESVRAAVWGHPGDESVRAAATRAALSGGTAMYDALLVAFGLMRERAAGDGGLRASAETGAAQFTFGDLVRFRVPGLMSGSEVIQPQGDCTIRRHPFSHVDAGRSVRRAIAVVTDGKDTHSQATLETVLLSAWGSGLPVFSFAVTERGGGGSMAVRGRAAPTGHVRALEAVAEYTGGAVIRATMDGRDRSGPAFWEGFSRLGAALRGHYTLGYVPDKGVDSPTLEDRRSIKVSLRRRGFDVLAPRDLVLGRGASEGAAFDLALRGFHEFASGRAEQALATFDTAAALGPGLGLVHYGRGVALSLLDNSADALAALRNAAALAPWIPDLNARIAELLVNVGDVDAAWVHVLRAYRGGSEVIALIDRLQEIAPRHVDLTRLPIGRRIKVLASGNTSVAGALAALPLLAAFESAIDTSLHVSLSHGQTRGPTVLRMDVTRAQRQGRRVSLSGWLTLENEAGKKMENLAGKDLLEQRFSIRDSSSGEDVRALAAAVVAQIEGLLMAR